MEVGAFVMSSGSIRWGFSALMWIAAALMLMATNFARGEEVERILHCNYQSEPVILDFNSIFFLPVNSNGYSDHLSLLVSPPVKNVTYRSIAQANILLSLAQDTQITITLDNKPISEFQRFSHLLSKKVDIFCANSVPRRVLQSHNVPTDYLHTSGINTSERNISSSEISLINIMISKHPLVSMSLEEYTMDISLSAISIVTPSLAGLSHAFSTLSQLLASPFPVVSLPIQIVDFPTSKNTEEFAGPTVSERLDEKRVISVDISRHFLPMSTLFRILDGMAASKFNLLRLQLPGHTLLSFQLINESTFTTSDSLDYHTDGTLAKYTDANLQELVMYSEVRGIEIFPIIKIPLGIFQILDGYFNSNSVKCSEVIDKSLLTKSTVCNPLFTLVQQPVEELLNRMVTTFPYPEIAINWNRTYITHYWFNGGFVATTEYAELLQDQFVSNLTQRMINIYSKRLVFDSRQRHRRSGSISSIGIDYSNVECNLWPTLVHSSRWGMITHIRFDFSPSNEGKFFEVYHRPASVEYRLATSRFLFFLRRLGVRTTEMNIIINTLNFTTARSVVKRSSIKKGQNPLNPIVTFWDELPLMRYILYHNSSRDGHFKMTSQCPTINDIVRRPIPVTSSSDLGLNTHLTMSSKSAKYNMTQEIVFLNVANGGRDRTPLLKKFLIEQASRGVVFVGLSELNGWQGSRHEKSTKSRGYRKKERILTDSKSYSGLLDLYPVIREKAAAAGFAFSFVTRFPSHPFNLGLVSSIPFKVIGVYGLPNFQRGCLHVYFEDINLHAFFTHLHAHSASMREVEASFLAAMVKPIIEKNVEKVVVLGDMNSLYRGDANYTHPMWTTLFSTNNHPTVKRLRQKFCHNHSSLINYEPLQILERVGLKDSCKAYCQTTPEFSSCYQHHCVYSEPTHFNPEVRRNTFSFDEAFNCLIFFYLCLLVVQCGGLSYYAEATSRFYFLPHTCGSINS